MSLESHPNLHAVKFAMSVCVPAFRERELGKHDKEGILLAYQESLRGKATKENVPDIEPMVDRVIEIINKQKAFGERLLEPRGEQIKDTIVNFVSAVETMVDAATEAESDD